MSKNVDRIAMLVIQANHLKTIAEEAERAFQEAQEEIVGIMEERGIPSVSAFEESTGLQYTGTLVQSETVEFDEAALRKALGARLWEQVTRQVVDRKKLEARIAIGDVTAKAVEKHTIRKPRRPYLKLTVKQQKITFM